MCNLYSVHTTQEAMRRAFEVSRDSAGNVPPLPAIFPDQMAPVVRTRDGERELIQMRWGFPPPPKVGNHPVTNVRNASSPFWRAWLKPPYRCLVPLTSFSEYNDTKPRRTPVWFGLNKDRPLAAFAGIWRPWTGVRGTKAEPVEGEHLLYSFLTSEPDGIVGPIHPKAMPVILTTPEEYEIWLSAPAEEALRLQRPLPDECSRLWRRAHDWISRVKLIVPNHNQPKRPWKGWEFAHEKLCHSHVHVWCSRQGFTSSSRGS